MTVTALLIASLVLMYGADLALATRTISRRGYHAVLMVTYAVFAAVALGSAVVYDGPIASPLYGALGGYYAATAFRHYRRWRDSDDDDRPRRRRRALARRLLARLAPAPRTAPGAAS